MDEQVEFLRDSACAVCLEERSDLKEVLFEESLEAISNGSILVKHLWFQPEDLQQKQVCDQCWDQVSRFHEFYDTVETTHKDVFQNLDSNVEYEIKIVSSVPPVVYDEKLGSVLSDESDRTVVTHENYELWETDVAEIFENDRDNETEEDEEDYQRVSIETSEILSSDNDEAEVEKILARVKEIPQHESQAVIDEENRLISEHCQMVCELCKVNCSTFQKLEKHFRQSHKIGEAYVICCDRKFNHHDDLLEHAVCELNSQALQNESADQTKQSAATDSQPEDYQTNTAPEGQKERVARSKKSFTNDRNLKQQTKLKQSSKEKNHCEVCGKSFSSKSLLTRHQKEHEKSPQETRLQCTICGKWMKNAGSLRKHKRRHEGEGGEHKCQLCDKVAPNALALQSHIAFVHRKEKVHQCSLCPKSFKRQFTLLEHMTTHTGDVLYSCPHCSKTFNSSANMHAHKKKVHPQEWEESFRERTLPFLGKDRV
ncbi:transcription factor grauzone-like [Uranotaenia lowii]|uniref:transcription factor grauzone-like n=1 Tax=Uranotaenia lowii TaxID=190385 RepID=UPI002479DC9C|nr:transcription factor grauzone-like [Uranotaenia lowii]